jgi:multicomponent Na+:H+ antiporter subunit E
VSWIPTLLRVLLLTVIWGALQGSFAPADLLLGAVLATAIVAFAEPLYAGNDPDETRADGTFRPLRRTWRVLVLVVVFLKELIKSSVEVARYTLEPNLSIRSGVLAYPLDVKTDREITVLANLISLTPGTLSLEVSDDQSTLYIHSMSVGADEGRGVIDDIKTSLEKHVHRALGPASAS